MPQFPYATTTPAADAVASAAARRAAAAAAAAAAAGARASANLIAHHNGRSGGAGVSSGDDYGFDGGGDDDGFDGGGDDDGFDGGGDDDAFDSGVDPAPPLQPAQAPALSQLGQAQVPQSGQASQAPPTTAAKPLPRAASPRNDSVAALGARKPLVATRPYPKKEPMKINVPAPGPALKFGQIVVVDGHEITLTKGKDGLTGRVEMLNQVF